MEFPDGTITETPLMASLREWKNPVVIFCLGILIGTTFYFQNIKQIILISLCLILLISFLFFKSKKIILFTVAIVFGYFYTVNYLGFTKPDLDQFLHERYIYIGEIKSKANNNRFNKTYDLKLKSIHFTVGPVASRYPSELRHMVPRSEPFPSGATHSE